MTKKKGIRIYKTPASVLRRNGWEYTDPARSKKQAIAFIEGGYDGAVAIIRKTPKSETNESFPYQIWTKQTRL